MLEHLSLDTLTENILRELILIKPISCNGTQPNSEVVVLWCKLSKNHFIRTSRLKFEAKTFQKLKKLKFGHGNFSKWKLRRREEFKPCLWGKGRVIIWESMD